jgi:hypothetical protein
MDGILDYLFKTTDAATAIALCLELGAWFFEFKKFPTALTLQFLLQKNRHFLCEIFIICI